MHDGEVGEHLMDWWLTIFVAGQVHCWQIGDPADDDALQNIIMRARTAVDFPPGDDWISQGDPGLRVQLAPGKPHDQLLSRATTHRLSELDAVDQAALDTYRSRYAQAVRASQLAAARRTAALLDPEDRAVLRAELSNQPTGGPR